MITCILCYRSVASAAAVINEEEAISFVIFVTTFTVLASIQAASNQMSVQTEPKGLLHIHSYS